MNEPNPCTRIVASRIHLTDYAKLATLCSERSMTIADGIRLAVGMLVKDIEDTQEIEEWVSNMTEAALRRRMARRKNRNRRKSAT